MTSSPGKVCSRRENGGEKLRAFGPIGIVVVLVALAISVAPPAAAEVACQLFDPDGSPPYEGPDTGAKNTEVPDANGGYVTIHPSWSNSGRIELALVRSIWVWGDPGGVDKIEWAFTKLKGESSARTRLTAWFNAGAASDSHNGNTTSYQTHTIGLYPRPSLAFPTTLFNWHGTLDASDNVTPLTHHFSTGVVLVHGERYNTCDDIHTKFSNLHYRSGPIDQVGTYTPWPEVYEVFAAFDDPNYICIKPYFGAPDTEFFVTRIADTDEDDIFCSPDSDPL